MKRTLAIAAALAVGVAAAALAQHGPGMHGPGVRGQGMGMAMGFGPAGGFGGRQVGVVTQVLQLTQDQVNAWQTIRDNAKATIQPLEDQMHSIHADIRAALDAGGADPAALGNKLIAAHDLGAKIEAARTAEQAAFRALLTDDQKAKLDVLEQVRQGMMQGRHMGPPVEGF